MDKDEKVKIAARLFFQNEDNDYESFEEAVSDMSKVSEEFIEHVVSGVLQPDEGYRTVFNEDGHVARVRTSDSFFEPVTEMTVEYGMKLQAEFEKAAEAHPEIKSAIVVLQASGWKLA